MISAELVPNAERVQRFADQVRREYEGASIIPEGIPERPPAPEDKGDFVRIGLRFLAAPEIFVDSPSSDTYYPGILGIGRSIAIGEEKYLIRTAEKSFKAQRLRTKAEMFDHLERIRKSKLTVAFMPIAYFTDFHLSPDSRSRISYKNGIRYLKFGVHEVKVFWSNRYVELDRFLFLAEGSAEWIAKPDPKNGQKVRVNVAFDRRSGKFDVTAETVARLNILDRKLGFAFTLTEKPSQ